MGVCPHGQSLPPSPGVVLTRKARAALLEGGAEGRDQLLGEWKVGPGQLHVRLCSSCACAGLQDKLAFELA